MTSQTAAFANGFARKILNKYEFCFNNITIKQNIHFRVANSISYNHFEAFWMFCCWNGDYSQCHRNNFTLQPMRYDVK